MISYCDYCNSHPEDTFNHDYHDTQYGFPLQDDNLLFERLILEINQAGLSWITILKKADNFRKAYRGFDIDKVARFTEKDRTRLLADAGIIRNRLKVNAAIENAKTDSGTAQGIRLLQRLAGRASSADKGRMDETLPKDICLHRRRDRQRIPHVHGVFARRARRGLPGLQKGCLAPPCLDAKVI